MSANLTSTEGLHSRQEELVEFKKEKFRERLQSNLQGCQRQLRLHPDTVLCDFVGLLLMYDNKIAEAIEAFKNSIQLNSQNHIASANLREAMRKRGEVVREEVAFSGSEEQRGIAWWSRAFYHMRMFNGNDAIKYFESALSCLPAQPKLKFYFAVALNRRGKFESAFKLLPESDISSVNRFAVLAQLIEAIGGSCKKPKPNVESRIQGLIEEARSSFEKFKERTPELKRAFSDVLVAAADQYRKWKSIQKAETLFNEAIDCAGEEAGTRAYQNRAKALHHMRKGQQGEVTPDATLKSTDEDLKTAIVIEPLNYSAEMDRIKRLRNSTDPSDWETALDLCASILSPEHYDPGLLNRIILLDLRMQLLEVTHKQIREELLTEIIPPITALQMDKHFNPNSPSGPILAEVKKSVIAKWDALLQKDSNRLSRLIDVAIQLRDFTYAEDLIKMMKDENDDLRYQRNRVRSLKLYMDKKFTESADQLIAAANFTLLHAAAGDLFTQGRNRSWPGDDAVVQRPTAAVEFPTFRNALAVTVIRSLPPDFDQNTSDDSQHFARCLVALHLLLRPAHLSGATSSSSTSPAPGHIGKAKELTEKAYNHYCNLFAGQPMWNRLDVPVSVMKVAAALWRAKEDFDGTRPSALYSICGASPDVFPPLTLSLVKQLQFGQHSRLAQKQFKSIATKLAQIRAMYLDLLVLELKIPENRLTIDDKAVKLVTAAKTLLDYFTCAFPLCLRTSKPSNTSKFNFPNLSYKANSNTTEELLNKHLKFDSVDFQKQFPSTFAVLLNILPRTNPAKNLWLKQMISVRNRNMHAQMEALAGKTKNQTMSLVELAHTVMKELPGLLKNLKQACDRDYLSMVTPPNSKAISTSAVQQSAQSACSSSSSSPPSMTPLDPVEYIEDVQHCVEATFNGFN